MAITPGMGQAVSALLGNYPIGRVHFFDQAGKRNAITMLLLSLEFLSCPRNQQAPRLKYCNLPVDSGTLCRYTPPEKAALVVARIMLAALVVARIMLLFPADHQKGRLNFAVFQV